MIDVAYFIDWTPYKGGAELTAVEFVTHHPSNVTVIPSYPERVPDADAYLLFNSVTFPQDQLHQLEGKPVFKYVNDLWPHGDPEVNAYLQSEATLIFTCDFHLDQFRRRHTGFANPNCHTVPPAIDLEQFRNGRSSVPDPCGGTCWVGRFERGKGLLPLAKWARETGTHVDVYGAGPEKLPDSVFLHERGHVPHGDIHFVYKQNPRFVFLPDLPEPFGRAAAEAWASGCELVLNDNVGAKNFLEENPGALATAAEDLWKIVLQ